LPDELPHFICPYFPSFAIAADSQSSTWQAIAPVPLRDTVTGASPRQPTSVKTFWNETEFRVLFEAQDDHVWATLREHDASLFDEEVVEFFFDPIGDLESYFEIEVNPLNAILDLVARRTRSGYRRELKWHCEGIRSAVKKNSSGWLAEISIPIASVSANLNLEGKSWRANFYRIDRPLNTAWELSAWSPTRRPNFHTPERFGSLEFVR
jgi:hypothetical protein